MDGSSDDFLNPPSSLSNDLSEALKISDFTDMTIVCDKKEFHCHKFILAARYASKEGGRGHWVPKVLLFILTFSYLLAQLLCGFYLNLDLFVH